MRFKKHAKKKNWIYPGKAAIFKSSGILIANPHYFCSKIFSASLFFLNDMPENRKFILLADDDLEDLDLLTEALIELEPTTIIKSVHNGRMLLDFLKQAGDAELPSLIVLDYNMPEVSGAEALQQLNHQPRYQMIPKIVWSTSNNNQYIKECMERGASDYFVKPSSNKELQDLARELLFKSTLHTG
ncbi:MAG: response regulator [Flavisolibacter sp.]